MPPRCACGAAKNPVGEDTRTYERARVLGFKNPTKPQTRL